MAYTFSTLAKSMIVVVVTLAILLVTFEYVVRYSPIGTSLNGVRRRPAARRASAWPFQPFSSA